MYTEDHVHRKVINYTHVNFSNYAHTNFINYAHRGASEYAPENTFAAFYLAIEMGANGIETDVKKTLDGKLVLFHDDTITRLTGMNGAIKDFTYEQLLELDLGSYKSKKYAGEKIVLLDDFLKYFGSRQLNFAIELKDGGIEKDTLEIIYKYNCQQKSIVTSFSFDRLINIRKFDNEISLGFLTQCVTEDNIKMLLNHNIQQICPKAENINKELVCKAKASGLSVRAWGVKNVELMEHAYNCGVDGVTVNFPDKLCELIRRTEEN